LACERFARAAFGDDIFGSICAKPPEKKAVCAVQGAPAAQPKPKADFAS
jgi:hypothetical protein